MLSICIPVYRYDVRPLVNELLRQAGELTETIEILVYDDASLDDGDWGKEELRQSAGIRYVELKENIGRAAIRNLMARQATHYLLLMMDADGELNPTFLSSYLGYIGAINDTADDARERFLIVGGRKYTATLPANPELYLHWWYGTRRESKIAAREEGHWLGFQSNNFLVTRSVLLENPFPEDADGYGHEDTLWGQLLKDLPIEQRIWIYHVENPTTHLGLEVNNVFLQKQKQAITNLRLLKSSHPHLRTRLIDLVEQIPFLPALARIIPEQWLIDYLSSHKRPNLYALDLLKLRWWGGISPNRPITRIKG